MIPIQVYQDYQPRLVIEFVLFRMQKAPLEKYDRVEDASLSKVDAYQRVTNVWQHSHDFDMELFTVFIV